MSAEISRDQNYLDSIATSLEESMIVDLHGEIEGFEKLPDGWVEIKGDERKSSGPDPLFKRTVANKELGIFAKIYAPRTKHYPQAAFDCLDELSKLDLEIPILPPIGFSGNTIFFPLGSPNYEISLERALPEKQIMKLYEIVEKHLLEYLGRMQKIVIVDIKGKQYIADPFDDSISSITDFLYGND